MDVFDCPGDKRIWNSELSNNIINLPFECLQANGSLGTVGVYTLGAVIVNVLMPIAVLLELVLYLCRYHRAARLAPHKTREGELLPLRFRLIALLDEFLNLVELLLGYHRLMLSFLPLAASHLRLEIAAIESV